MKLQGAHVVVIGGSTGIGFAAAKLARQEGAEVTIAGRAQEKPGKRIGTAEEVAQTMLMFMTNEYITGAVLHIDGGGRYV